MKSIGFTPEQYAEIEAAALALGYRLSGGRGSQRAEFILDAVRRAVKAQARRAAMKKIRRSR